MLLSGEPSIIGREPAGHSATVATHQPALTTIAAARQQLLDAAAQPRRRRNQVDKGERRQHEEGLHHLGQEGKAEQRPGREPAGAARSSARTRQ